MIKFFALSLKGGVINLKKLAIYMYQIGDIKVYFKNIFGFKKVPENGCYFFSELKFYSISVSPTTKFYSVSLSPTTALEGHTWLGG